MRAIENPAVAAAFEAFSPKTRTGVLALRDVIFDTAQATPTALPLQEALRWGNPPI